MTRLIGIIILILAAFIAYMYFFGNNSDKENAHAIVNETKDLGKSVGDFILRQKDSYDESAFDSLSIKIKTTIDKLKGKSEKNSEPVRQNLLDLEKQLKQIDVQKLSEEDRAKLKKLIDDLDKELN